MDICDNESVLDMDTASLLEFNIEKTTNKTRPATIIGATSTPTKKVKSQDPDTSPSSVHQRCTTPKLQKVRKPKVLTPKHLANKATVGIEREQEPARCEYF